jgi:hypothetical protein
MAMICASRPTFRPLDEVVSLVYHTPEIEPGTRAVVVSPKIGSLYAVQLPSGEYLQWLAGFELEEIERRLSSRGTFTPGSLARVVSAQGHAMIKEGMIVRIIQSLERVPFYDVKIEGKYHRWLAEFEIALLAATGRFITM